jgi:predicted GIY-YIG superfamily endonuclease
MLFHNELGDGFTSKYRPWEIVYVRECESKVVAQQLERKIKSWKSRVMIGRLLNGEDDLL